MSKTIIYSCGKCVTSKELVSISPEVEMYFPEIGWDRRGPIPLTQEEQVALLPDLIGKTIVTVSETIILVILREIRKCRIHAADVELYCNGQRVEISADGQLIDPWAGGFFETGFQLRFA
jgi:hypothetical protein